MSYHKWLKIVPKNTDNIQIDKVRQESIDTGEMAAGSPSEAAKKLARVLEQQKASPKILVVGDGSFSAPLSDYAITMGQKLDCEIIALSIFDESFNDQDVVGENEKDHFIKKSELGASRFADKAASGGVKFSQLAKIGVRKDIVANVVNEIAGIRYVLTEPEEFDEEQTERIQLPVIETTGSQL